MKAKQTLKVSAMLLVLTVALFACKESPYVPEPGNNNEAGSGTILPIPTADIDDVAQFPNFHFPDGTLTPDANKKQLTVKQAIAKGHEIGSGATSNEAYYIYGYVSAIDEAANADAIASGYGNFFFYIKDKPTDLESFYCYQVYAGPNQKKFLSTQDIQVGNRVIMYTQLLNFGNTIETPGGKSTHGYIYNRTFRAPELKGDGTLENPYHVSDIGTVLSFVAIGGDKPTENVYVEGYAVGCLNHSSTESAVAEEAIYQSPFTVRLNLLLAEELSEDNVYNFGELIYMDICPSGQSSDKFMKAIHIMDFLPNGNPVPEAAKGTYSADVLGHKVLVKGNLQEVYGMPALKNLQYVKLHNGVEIQ